MTHRFLAAAILALGVPGLARAQPTPTPGDPTAEPPAADTPPTPPSEPPVSEPPPKAAAEPKAALVAPPPATGEASASAPKADPPSTDHDGSFQFGSYGRAVVGTDARGGPGRDADIVLRGSRMDEDNYAEIELRREDDWGITGIHTDVVFTLAVASPVFHYNGDFDVALALRNLYLEARDIGTPGLSAWAGSRMVRGDDIYVLDYWPLDNLNLLGGGVGYKHEVGTSARLVVGATQPDSPFFSQSVLRPAPLDQFGAVAVELLDRQKLIGALRVGHDQRFGDRDKPGPGIKAVLYGEGHVLPDGEREPKPGQIEELPSDGGFVVGGQFTAYTGERDTFVHVFARYASGLAAYGQFATPGQLGLDKTTDGAHELVFAAGGNVEYDLFGLMLGAYVRSFRDASEPLNYEDVDEGVVLLRPTLWFGEIAGASLEGAFELAQRGVLSDDVEDPAAAPAGPTIASLWRIGVMPFLTPAGRGGFARPQIRLFYNVAFRDAGARSLYPEDHPFRERDVEHFIGLGAEWWFNSSSYGN